MDHNKLIIQSIAQWERRAEGRYSRPTLDKCPLCVAHHRHYMSMWQQFVNWLRGRDQCGTCPVREYTGLAGCVGTPVDDYIAAETDEERVEAAKCEISFLAARMR